MKLNAELNLTPSSELSFSVNLGNNTIGFAQAGIKGALVCHMSWIVMLRIKHLAAIKYIGWDRLYALER
jgi:hypothetical protein